MNAVHSENIFMFLDPSEGTEFQVNVSGQSHLGRGSGSVNSAPTTANASEFHWSDCSCKPQHRQNSVFQETSHIFRWLYQKLGVETNIVTGPEYERAAARCFFRG